MHFGAVEIGGKQDFDNSLIQVTFPATTQVGVVEQTVSFPLVNDDFNEDLEGAYLHATIDPNGNPLDVQGASAIRSGVTLININDDDGIIIIRKS